MEFSHTRVAEVVDRLVFLSYLPGDKLWWADQGTDQIGTCDKKDGSNWKVLRNSTSPMMHMKIYNETVQKGTGAAATWPLFLRLHNICFSEIT